MPVSPSLGPLRIRVAMGAACGLLVVGIVAPVALASAGAPVPARTATSAPAQANLLQSATHLYGGSAADWAPLSATATDVASPAATAGATVAVASTGSGYAVATLGSGSGPLTATAGPVYSGTVSLQAADTPRAVAPYLLFFSSTGKTLATVTGPSRSDTVGLWSPSQPVVAIAPPGTAYVALRLVWQAPLGEVHYLSSPSLNGRARGSRGVVGPLHTSANKVYDARGPIVLRGLHRFGFEGSVNGTSIPNNFSRSEVDHARAWGANMIRLSLASSFWLPTDCHYDPTYAARVDQAVQWITGDGMVALVDLHYNSTSSCSPVAAQQMADHRGPTFWSSVASRYKSNPLVAFDLYNEPHDISDAVWRDGGTVTSGGTTWQAAGMQALYNAVRGAGAKNLVIASGNSWANRFPTRPLTGTNIAYGVHAYTCPTSTTGSDCLANPTDPSSLLASWVAPSATYPVVVSEFGWPAKNDGRYVRNVIAYAERHGWGWSAFAWDGGTDGTFDLLADVGSYQPNPTGMPVLEGLRRNG
jgi:hypothetical protein